MTTNPINFTDPVATLQTGTPEGFWLATFYMIYGVMVLMGSIRFGVIPSLLASTGLALVIGIFMVFFEVMAMVWIAPLVALLLLITLYVLFFKSE